MYNTQNWGRMEIGKSKIYEITYQADLAGSH